MARIAGELWQYNLCRVVVIDVSDDYRLMQPPMPSEFYPVLKEMWLPQHLLARKLPDELLVPGYLYDWHDAPMAAGESWYVGVVEEFLAASPTSS